MESANEPTPQISVNLPGLVGYLTDAAVVRHDDGYEPANDFEASFEQLPYAVTRMRFFEDLRNFTTSLIPFRATSRPWRSSIDLHALVITERDGGVDSSWLREFVQAGGIVILTDGAVRTLSRITDLPASAIVRQTSDPGTDVPRMTEASRDFTHPLLAGVDNSQAYAEQLYEPVPVGFSLDEGASLVGGRRGSVRGGRWSRRRSGPARDRDAGRRPDGQGRIVVIGGLLPSPRRTTSTLTAWRTTA